MYDDLYRRFDCDGRDDRLAAVTLSNIIIVRHTMATASRRSLAERIALMIRCVKSAFALLLTKVTKPRCVETLDLGGNFT